MRLPRLSLTGYRRITLATVIVLAAIIVTGAGVRLTGSGLGCPDWPTCDEGRIVAPLDEPHAVIEFVNRLVTGIVSVAVIAAILGSLLVRPKRRDLVRWSLALVVGLALEIPLGGVTVWMGLTPPVVIAHFLLAVALVWVAVVLHHRAGGPDGAARPLVSAAVLRLSRVVVGAAVVVLCTGTVVTGVGPHGGDPSAERLPVLITTAARLHGSTVLVLLGLATLLLHRLYRSGASTELRRRGGLLVAAVLAQGALGYTQYFTGVPPVLVGLHVLGAVLVWLAVLGLHLNLVARDAPVTGPEEATEPVLAGRP